MSIGSFIFGMLLYSLAGGFHFGRAVSHFKEKHYTRAGVYGMFAISMVLIMGELVFRIGGMA